MRHNFKFKYFVLSFIFILALLVYACTPSNRNNIYDEVKLGYFRGGANDLFSKAYREGNFDANGVNVILYTTIKDESDLIKVEKIKKWVRNQRQEDELFGWMTGDKIVEYIAQGDLDGGLIGSGSFLNAIKKNISLVAVAIVGMCDKENPCRVIVLNKGVEINNVSDWKGKKICYFRNTSVDYLALKKYFKNLGILDEVILINTRTFDDWLSFANGTADACILHYGSASSFDKELENHDGEKLFGVKSIEPRMFHTLLVFNKNFIKENRGEVKKILKTYLNITENEYISKEQSIVKNKTKPKEYKDLGKPASRKGEASVNISLLNELKFLMLEEGILEKDIDIESHVDNSLLNEIMEE